jgi:hypothetical protein
MRTCSHPPEAVVRQNLGSAEKVSGCASEQRQLIRLFERCSGSNVIQLAGLPRLPKVEHRSTMMSIFHRSQLFLLWKMTIASLKSGAIPNANSEEGF